MTKQGSPPSTSHNFSGGVVRLDGVENCRRLSSSAWNVHYEQLSPGRFNLELTFLSTRDVTHCRERVSSGFRLVGTLQPELVAVIVADSETVSEGKWWFGDHPADGVALVMGGGVADIVFPPGSSRIIALFRKSDFRHCGEVSVGVDLALREGEVGFLSLKPDGLDAIRRDCNRLLDGVLAGTSKTRPVNFSSRLMGILFDRVETPVRFLPISSSRGGLLQRALAIAEVEGFKIPVSALCERLNASRRTLEYLFQDCLGVGPATYLKLHRLNQCRIRLAQAEPGRTSVQAIARASGFRGSGKFAAAYCELFGELPAETLKRTSTKVEPAFVLDSR